MSKLICITASVLSLSGCVGESEIGATRKPLKGGHIQGIGEDWEVLCIDGVEYIFRSHGAYSSTLTAHWKSDGTLYTCGT